MPAADSERHADVFATELSRPGIGLVIIETRAVTGELLQGLFDDGHWPELVELVEHDHDRPGFGYWVGQGGAHRGNELAEEQTNERRQCECHRR